MEIEGHPTQDIVDELSRRGAIRADGTSTGPRVDAIRFILERIGEQAGFWMFLPEDAFRTGLDDIPG